MESLICFPQSGQRPLSRSDYFPAARGQLRGSRPATRRWHSSRALAIPPLVNASAERTVNTGIHRRNGLNLIAFQFYRTSLFFQGRCWSEVSEMVISYLTDINASAHTQTHAHTLKVKWVAVHRFRATAPPEAIMAQRSAICILLIHGPISCLHTSAYRCRSFHLRANKLDCIPDMCNTALLITKVESSQSEVGHLGFITQIPIGLHGGATFEYVTLISARAFHTRLSSSSSSISSRTPFDIFLHNASRDSTLR